MRNTKLVVAAVASAMLSMGIASTSYGQAEPQRGQGRGNFDPAAMRERMNTMLKERLGVTDEEWKVLQPRIEKVQTAQRNSSTRGGGFGGRGGRGGDNNNTPTTPESPLAAASSELRKATESKETPAADVTAKLAAYRAARTKAKEELTAAQKELTEVVTPRQEAILVAMGMLD